MPTYGHIENCKNIEFEKKVIVQVDNTKLGDTEDPYGLYREPVRDEVRQAAQDYRD